VGVCTSCKQSKISKPPRQALQVGEHTSERAYPAQRGVLQHQLAHLAGAEVLGVFAPAVVLNHAAPNPRAPTTPQGLALNPKPWPGL
jgi:hypothetical protein